MYALTLDTYKPAEALRRGDVVSLTGYPHEAAPLESVQPQLDGKVLVKQIGSGEHLISSDNRIAVFTGCIRN